MSKRLKINIWGLVLALMLFFNIMPAYAIEQAPTCPAGTFCLNVPIGKVSSFQMSGSNNMLGDYIKVWYGFLLGSVGIMATVMIMWGGFKYITSRGDKGIIETAKAQIISALIGVVLAFSAYTLLNIINPQLTTITTPNLPQLQGGNNVAPAAAPAPAPAAPAAPAAEPAPAS